MVEPKFFQFLRLTYKFQAILRAPKVTGKESKESDAEHSFQLALAVWYLNSTRHLRFNQEKLIKYALVHDLVELYAGDTDTFAANKNFKDSKHDREMASLKRITKETTDFSELAKLIQAYELKRDRESKFVYAIDKILPFINAYFYGQKEYYIDNKITFQHWKDTVLDKLKKVGGKKLAADKTIRDSLAFLGTLKDFFYHPN